MTADAKTRHGRGLAVVVVLGLIFFTLLALLILHSGKRKTAPSPQSEPLAVLPLRLRLRTKPGSDAPVVATATAGARLTMLEDRGAWVRLQDEDGLAGWAERNALERASERDRRLLRAQAIRKLPVLAAVVSSRTPLYAGPGIFYPVIGDVAAGAAVKVFTRDHDFYAIDNAGGIAYADVDAIDVSSAGTRQLEVVTRQPVNSDSTPPSLLPSSPAPEPAPIAEERHPEIPTEAPAKTDPTGVYTAVPPGGTQPEEVDRVVPRYPPLARRAGVEGAVVIRGIVRRDGRIDDVEIIKNLPYGVGEAAREAVSRWRFRPATFRGEPVDVYYTVTVNFRLQ